MPREATTRSVVALFTGRPGPANRARRESQAQLDALGSLQAQQRERKPSVEFAIPLHMAAESDGQSGRDDLDDAAERVSGFFARVDFRNDFTFRFRIGDAHLRLFRNSPQLRDAQLGMRLRFGRADTRDVAEHLELSIAELR